MDKNPQLSDAQLDIMRIIWQNGGSIMFAELSEALNNQGKIWKTNTVLTFLARLAERGMVEVRKHGRLNEYVALLSEGEYLSAQTRSFVEHVYGGNAKHLVSALLGQNYLSGDDYEELKRFWNGGKGI